MKGASVRSRSIINTLNQGAVLVSDGAWGTLLQQRGLEPGECPELWNITHRSDVYAIAKCYIDAGSNAILTNSFGGHPIKLKQYSLESRTDELNRAAAEISREAAGDDHFVMGSMGPTGVMLMLGDISPSEVYDGYALQASALQRGGVDAICVETMTDIEEATLAVKAAKEATGLEVLCTFTFDRTAQGEYRTMMGIAPAMIVEALKNAGADAIGSNCGNGMKQMIDIIRELRSQDQHIPILIHANAGIPQIVDGKIVFPETPEYMASFVPELINAGASIIGGCCGTNPDHIRSIAQAIQKSVKQ